MHEGRGAIRATERYGPFPAETPYGERERGAFLA